MLGELIAVCALAADPGLAVEPLGPVRPGGLLRVAVQCADVGVPQILALRLLDGESILATAATELPAGGRAVLVLAPSELGSGTLRVRVIASWSAPGNQTRTRTAEAPVATPTAVLATVAAVIGRLRASGSTDPLPWLWAEQVAELRAGGASAASVAEVAALGDRLTAWLAGSRTTTDERALLDPVDGSVQPYRLIVPAGSGPHPVLVVLPPATPALGKAHWPQPEPRLVDAARAGGLAMIVCYPAGDRAWNGAARRRIALTIAAAAAAAPLDLAQGACVGAGPGDGLPYALHRPPASPDGAWCRSVLGPRLPSTPGTGWADAPFAVVVGSAEHTVAATANRRLAESFRAAYTAHAHAVVELLDDRCDPALLASRNLVLIGNPRSNRVLAGLRLDLPWRWDHRSVSGTDGANLLRATMPSLLCQTQLGDGRIAIILDGPPPAWGDGLPLSTR